MDKLNIIQNLYKQFLIGKYCDLQINVENTTFHAHSCVVAAASWVLEAILQNSIAGDSKFLHPVKPSLSIQLHGVTPYSVSSILNYIYTNTLDPEIFTDFNKQKEVLHAAKVYKIDEMLSQLSGKEADKVNLLVENNFEVMPLPSERLDERLFEKLMPAEGEVVKSVMTDQHEGTSVAKIIELTSTNLDVGIVKKSELSLKDEQEFVSQCFKYSKDHGILYCILCCEICSDPTELVSHMLEHKEGRRVSVRAAVPNVNEDAVALSPSSSDDTIKTRSRKRRKLAPKKAFTCAECGVSYTTKVYLIRHYNIRHPESCFCKVCGDVFQNTDDLQVHLRVHESELEEDETQNQLSLKLLNSRKGKGKRVFTCNLCFANFGKKRELTAHLQSIHGIVKPMHVCTVCGKEFKEKASLRSHTRVHTGEKPYMCSFCGKSFADQKTWKDHERRHRGEKPFLCTACGKSFTYRQSFTRHMKFHEGKRPFQCSFCGKAFVLRQNLKEHEKRHNK